MNGGQVWTQNSLPLEQLGGRAALHGLALLPLGRLFGEVAVKRSPALARPGRDGSHGARVDSPHAVNRRYDANAVSVLQLIDPLHPVLSVPIGKRLLRLVEGPAVQSAP